ncbi:MAG: type II CRISPR-associated endonuclease Cas1 [Bacteroidales bacterium]|nr:type II CRISPR-associated endonuclease Cas1 [Bacteroidales bacterium]
MIKRTLYFGNPAYLSLKNSQLVLRLPEVEKSDLPEKFKQDAVRTMPIEDLGIVVIDNKQITLTNGLIEKLLENNVAIIFCGSNHLPIGLSLPLYKNTTLTERWHYQMEASLPLKKQLWQQTIQQKILNQAAVLKKEYNCVVKNMLIWSNEVRSGDPDNFEGRAAAYYWKNTFPDIDNFTRDDDDFFPNSLLNYGYAILRAIVARALVSSGLVVQLGIHHHNKYNPYCLADDIMEPYRPYVDEVVIEIIKRDGYSEELTTQHKKDLLSIPVIDVIIENKKRPLEVAVSTTTASLFKCFSGELRKISYPQL